MATQTKTKRKPGRVFWLTREGVQEDDGDDSYVLWRVKPRRHQDDYGNVYFSGKTCGEAVDSFCASSWHRFAKPIKALKPGGGPIKVRVTIEAEV